MPNIKSAKKRVLTNKAVKDSSKENVNDAVKKIDNAVSKGVITKNTAARKKSRLMKKVNAK